MKARPPVAHMAINPKNPNLLYLYGQSILEVEIMSTASNDE